MAEEDAPAPCEGAGDRADTKTPDWRPPYRPWARREISDWPLALDNAAREAIRFANAVFDLDREAEGMDWASRVQARVGARPEALLPCLPPGMTAATRALAERMVLHG